MKINIDHLTPAQKLVALAEILETKVNPDNFDMRQWFWHRNDKLCPLNLSDLHTCGTAACAFGVAALAFEGLKIEDGVISTADDQLEGYDAAEHFFQLTGEDALALFSQFSYDERPTPQQVAARLRAFAAGDKTVVL